MATNRKYAEMQIAMKEIENSLKTNFDLNKEIEKLEKKGLENIEARYEASKKIREETEKLNFGLENSIKKFNSELDILKKIIPKTEEERKNIEKMIKFLEQSTVSLEIEQKILTANLELRKNEEEIAKRNLENYKKIDELYKSMDTTVQSIVEKITKISASAYKDSIFGKIEKLKETGQSLGSILSHIGNTAFKQVFSMNMMVTGVDKVIKSTFQLIKAQEEAIGSFGKATGTGNEYSKMIRDLGRDHLTLGIDSKDAANAILSLRNNFTDFSMMSKESQENLSLFTAEMEKLGVNTEQTTKNIQISIKTLGQTSAEAVKTQRQIATYALSLGVSQNKMAQDFEKTMPILGAFGDKAVEEFRKAASAAKATGIEISSLLNITQKFDTFEGAAESVGKLNAILGGPFLDSMEMVMSTSPAERMKILSNSVKEAGLSFDSMTYYQRKAVASAMGLQDVNDLAKMLTGNIDEVIASSEKEAKTQEDLNKLIKEAQPIYDKFKQMFISLSISMGPVVDALKWLVDGFLSLNENTKNILGYIVGGGGFLILLTKMVMPIKNLAGGVYGLAKSFKKTSDTIKPASDAIDSSGNVAKKSSSSFLSLGAGIALIGLGIGVATFGISQLAKNMENLTNNQIIGLVSVIGILTAGLIGLGAIGTVAAPGIIAIGVGIGLIGAGIGVAAFGISLIVNSLTNMFKSISSGADKFLVFVSGMERLKELGFSGAAKIASLVKVISSLGDAMKEVIEMMGEIPEEKTMRFTKIMSVASNLSTEKINNVKNLVDQSERYRKIQNEIKVDKNNEDVFTKLLDRTNNSSNKIGNNISSNPIVINLKIGEMEFKRMVVDIMNRETKPSFA